MPVITEEALDIAKENLANVDGLVAGMEASADMEDKTVGALRKVLGSWESILKSSHAGDEEVFKHLEMKPKFGTVITKLAAVLGSSSNDASTGEKVRSTWDQLAAGKDLLVATRAVAAYMVSGKPVEGLPGALSGLKDALEYSEKVGKMKSLFQYEVLETMSTDAMIELTSGAEKWMASMTEALTTAGKDLEEQAGGHPTKPGFMWSEEITANTWTQFLDAALQTLGQFDAKVLDTKLGNVEKLVKEVVSFKASFSKVTQDLDVTEWKALIARGNVTKLSRKFLDLYKEPGSLSECHQATKKNLMSCTGLGLKNSDFHGMLQDRIKAALKMQNMS